jgi:hypothetical protein
LIERPLIWINEGSVGIKGSPQRRGTSWHKLDIHRAFFWAQAPTPEVVAWKAQPLAKKHKPRNCRFHILALW